ncbi:hypothetical protein SB87_gp003 [Parapoxvirus red deer/HL953]|uniref:Uncharacterized protein n=1 Tax=Parapoxvirus red deer/HL953 TaxID=1579460 RepID=A0A0A7MEL1_9POXV|nr:hypothetical protein SB87_gp003 [Parapoxvirus red deer/HL953]AIZ77256.1 hypothetical protein [Parapoxvirus red deer/HL953]
MIRTYITLGRLQRSRLESPLTSKIAMYTMHGHDGGTKGVTPDPGRGSVKRPCDSGSSGGSSSSSGWGSMWGGGGGKKTCSGFWGGGSSSPGGINGGVKGPGNGGVNGGLGRI